jgi:peptide-N4-(N-acetyl-beta-glucosaminyl)asparagine amidase
MEAEIIEQITTAYFERCSAKLRSNRNNNQNEMIMIGKIEGGFQTIQMHHSSVNQEKVLKIIDVDEIHNRTNLLQESDGKISHTEALVKILLAWFKNEFFKWCDTVPCIICNSKTIPMGSTKPTAEEAAFKASVTELHKCSICNHLNRFPRYNDPMKLLETRKGRCGEWANCFGMILTSMGIETRYVIDFTDQCVAYSLFN